MMEITQSTPNGLELKELKDDPVNGLKPQLSDELEPSDVLQLSDSDHEEDVGETESKTPYDDMESGDNFDIDQLLASEAALLDSPKESGTECIADTVAQNDMSTSILEPNDKLEENDEANCSASPKAPKSVVDMEEKEQIGDNDAAETNADSPNPEISKDITETPENGDDLDAKNNELSDDKDEVLEKEVDATETQPDPLIVPDSDAKSDDVVPVNEKDDEEPLEISSDAGSANSPSKSVTGNTIEIDDSDEETEKANDKISKTESSVQPEYEIPEIPPATNTAAGTDEIPGIPVATNTAADTDGKEVDPLLCEIDEALSDSAPEKQMVEEPKANLELPKEETEESFPPKEDTEAAALEVKKPDDDVVVLLDDDCETEKDSPKENKDTNGTIPMEDVISMKTVENTVNEQEDLGNNKETALETEDVKPSESEKEPINVTDEMTKPSEDSKINTDDKNADAEDVVVLVLDEDMNDTQANETESSDTKQKSETDSAAKESDACSLDEKNQNEEESKEKTSDIMDPDNSDNAQDKFPDDQGKCNTESENASPENDNLLEQVASPQNTNSNDQFDEEPEEMKHSDTESSEVSQDVSKKVTIEYDEHSKDITIELEEENEAERNDTVSNDENKSFKRSLSPSSTPLEAKKMKIDSDLKEEDKKDVNLEEGTAKIDTDQKSKPDLTLDFLKRFKKPLSKMSKADLEELVLQKVVEGMVHRSELSDLRELIEKQEKLIASHRSKVAELTKQFRDLEMVHNRAVKDLEQKNQQFIMPVKITRAVGLQVLIPKRSDHASNTSLKNITSSPLNSSPSTPKMGGPAAIPPTPLNDNSKRTRPGEINSIEPAKRIRCNQKVTPLRPDTLKRNTGVGLNNSAKMSPSNPLNMTQTQQNTSTPNSSKPASFKSVMRNVVPSSQQASTVHQNTAQIHVVERPIVASPLSNTGNLCVRKSTTPKPVQSNGGQKMPVNNFQSSPERRVPPVILRKSNNGRNTAVATLSQPAAQSANKSVIDLTDEDDKPAGVNPPALVAIPSSQSKASPQQGQNRVTTYVINKQNAPQQRAAQMSQNGNVNAAARNNRFVPIAPKPNSQAAQTALASGMRAQQANVAAVATLNTKRISTPAPLPKPPNVPSNPSWKAPPPRPTIRISNIDSGIVISWTMDDSNDGNAEVTNYQIYAYQETSTPPQTDAWRHVGDVKAMLLPMAVTLTQFQEGQRYFFAVRAIDIHGRYGPFSIPKTW